MGRILAVASNTIKQALRMKIAVVFIILLLVLLPTIALTATGDGTLKGRMQTLISYGLSLVGFLLSVLTIITTVYTTTSDLVHRQVFMVLTKPIRRVEYLLGKLAGVVFLDLGLLMGFSALIYGIAILAPRWMESSDADFLALHNELFTARRGITPKEEDVTEEIEKEYEELNRTQQLEEYFQGVPKAMILSQLASRKRLESRAVAVGQERVWEFSGIRLQDPNASLFVRFKYDVAVNPPDLSVYGLWAFGDFRPLLENKPPRTPIDHKIRKDSIRTFHEIEVPGEVVAEDGYVAVAFLNDFANNTVVIFPPEDGLELLYQAGTFTANYLRGVILIFCKLIFLACLGIMAASFLSFPVALLLCFLVFLTGTGSVFVLESFSYLGQNIGLIYDYTIAWIVRLLPQFDTYNPTTRLVAGRLISWGMVARALLYMVGVKAMVLLGCGLLIYNRREVAATTT